MEQQDKKMLGQIFIEHKLVTEDQINLALRHQRQTGGKIGSILLELGFLKSDDLLEFLSKHFGVPSADIHQLTINPEVLSILPYEKMKEYQAIPVALGAKNVFMIMADPGNEKTLENLAFLIGRNVQPVVVAAGQIKEALACLEARKGDLSKPLLGSELHKYRSSFLSVTEDIDLRTLIAQMHEVSGSYLLLTAGVAPSIKVNNEIKRLNIPFLTPDQVKSFAAELMTDDQKIEFQKNNDIDFGIMSPELGRFRVNVFRQRSSVSIVIKSIQDEIPTIESLALPGWLQEYALRNQGLILITGPSGQGKSTTLAAMLDAINSSRKCNIITIEDPIEYLHKHKLSNVNQREVGRDTDSFHQGLRRIFRQAPDVVVIGEMRDPESIAIAIQAARTGQLVLSTMNSNFSTTALEQITEGFPSEQQHQMRAQLAESFLLVFNQRLAQKRDGSGRVVVYEKLLNSVRIRNLIREGKTHQIRTLLQRSSDEFESLDTCLARYVREGKIGMEEALKFCENPATINEAAARMKS